MSFASRTVYDRAQLLASRPEGIWGEHTLSTFSGLGVPRAFMLGESCFRLSLGETRRKDDK